MERTLPLPGTSTPGRHGMRHGTPFDAAQRARSPAALPQPFLRSSSSFGHLHGPYPNAANEGLQAPRRMASNQFSRAPKGNRETVALMARVQSVSQKADALLSNAGRT